MATDPASSKAPSRRVSVVVDDGDLPESALTADAAGLDYMSVVNYQRSAKGANQTCVMCGSSACKNGGVVIPRQNKDVCRDCDKALWRHEPTGAYFKWCKGCKNFLQIGTFSQKLDAAKCDRCRARGRTSYLLKKRTAGGSFKTKAPAAERPRTSGRGDSVAAISLVALARATDDDDDETAAATPETAAVVDDVDRVSSNFGCSLQEYQRKRCRSESIGSEAASTCDGRDDDDESAAACAAAVAAAADKGMLFELANIHATIIKLEQRAELVAPLEDRIRDLERQLAEAAARETALKTRLEGDDESSEASRPRLISFDEAHAREAATRAAAAAPPARALTRSRSASTST